MRERVSMRHILPSPADRLKAMGHGACPFARQLEDRHIKSSGSRLIGNQDPEKTIEVVREPYQLRSIIHAVEGSGHTSSKPDTDNRTLRHLTRLQWTACIQPSYQTTLTPPSLAVVCISLKLDTASKVQDPRAPPQRYVRSSREHGSSPRIPLSPETLLKIA